MAHDGHTAKASQAPFVLYVALTALFGLLNATTGPVLPDLEEQAGVDSAGVGVAFLYRGMGSMVGGFAIGFVVDAVRNPHAVLVALLLVKAVLEFTMPYGQSLPVLSGQLAGIAFCGNAIATVTMTSTAWSYGKLMGLQMNLLNAVFGVGASFAPAMVVLCRRLGLRGTYSYWVLAASDIGFVAGALLVPATPNPKLAEASRRPSPKVAVAEGAPADEEVAASGYVEMRDAPSQAVDWPGVMLCGASILCATMCEAAIQFWLFYFAVRELGWSVEAAGVVNTAFFASFTATRFVCGWLVTFIDASRILWAGLALSLVSSLGMVSPWRSAELSCLGMVGVGMGVSPFAANAVTVLGQRSFISGRAQGVVRILSALGALVGTSGVGFLRTAPSVAGFALPAVVYAGLAAEAIVTTAMLLR